MAAKESDTNVAMDNGSEFGKESESQSVDTESRVDDSENYTAKTGIGSSSCCVFRAVPPFLQKLYEMLGNDEFSPVVSWSCAGTSFVIKNPHSFTANVLPLYYKHNNFQSFTTQLHSYGFKKGSWEQCEYKNEYFRKGERNLLKNIKRRDHYSKISQPCSNSTEMEGELTNLKEEHDQIKAEITKLNEEQQTLVDKFASLKNRTISDDEDHTRLMNVAKKILEKQKDPMNAGLPMPEESRETEARKGKRKLGVESDTTRDNGEKRMLEEEETAEHLPDTFFSVEDLYRGPMDWVQYVKELQDYASYNLKPSTQESI